jgi:predicted CopG family antitoxin
MATTISISEELADDLYAMKGRGESYEDVIRGLMKQAGEAENV